MIFSVVSIFPQMFESITNYGITARAFEREICQLFTVNPRDFTKDKYHKVDDKGFGGSAGAVMKIEPLELALKQAVSNLDQQGVTNLRKIYLSPQGQRVDQAMINSLVKDCDGMVLVCGRYEGVDERFIERNIDLELSIGDLVVSGGELPAMLLMDSIIRHLPNALNDENSAQEDSFMNGLLDFPHYTMPRVYKGDSVPEVLLSGDHKQIKRWQMQMSLWRTYLRRPDLLKLCKLTKEQSGLLEDMYWEDVAKNSSKSKS